MGGKEGEAVGVDKQRHLEFQQPPQLGRFGLPRADARAEHPGLHAAAVLERFSGDNLRQCSDHLQRLRAGVAHHRGGGVDSTHRAQDCRARVIAAAGADANNPAGVLVVIVARGDGGRWCWVQGDNAGGPLASWVLRNYSTVGKQQVRAVLGPLGHVFHQQLSQWHLRQADSGEQLQPALRGKHVSVAPPAKGDRDIGGDVQLARLPGIGVDPGWDVHRQHGGANAFQEVYQFGELLAQTSGGADAGDCVDNQAVIACPLHVLPRWVAQHRPPGVAERGQCALVRGLSGKPRIHRVPRQREFSSCV